MEYGKDPSVTGIGEDTSGSKRGGDDYGTGNCEDPAPAGCRSRR